MKAIPQRDLRNRSGEMLRLAASGEKLTITVDGRPVAQLGPLPRRNWVGRAEVAEILRTGGTGDATLFDDIAELV